MHSSGRRVGLGLLIAGLLAPIIALGVFLGSAVSWAGWGTNSNPLAGVTFYANPESSARLAADAAAATEPESTDAGVLARLADQPAAIWLLPEEYPLSTVEEDVSALVDAASAVGQVPVFVVYGIPNRDCGSHSAGGLSVADYPKWVSAIARALTTSMAVVILEPDALASAQQCGNVDQRVQQIQQGVAAFAVTTATVYLDAGHSNWLDATTMAALLNRAGVQKVRGFATNVSNYNDSAAEEAYAEAVSALTNGAHFVVDTSRNGAGSNGEWCNPDGRALGSIPAATTDGGLRDANLWVKQPGESDGTCNAGPDAGEWWNESALQLAESAGWR